MNIYEKLAEARVKLQEKDLKKSGENKFAKFKYYELADLLPAINSINKELKIVSLFEFENEKATLKLVNSEKIDECIEFSIPCVQASMKGSNPIQELGATSTYLRRYLYLNAYEIQEADVVDSLNKDQHGEKKDRHYENFDKDKTIKLCLSLLGDDMDKLDKLTGHYKVNSLIEMSEMQLKDCIKNLKRRKS